MGRLGDEAMRPFLQDVLLLGPLLRTMGGQLSSDPALVPAIVGAVGPLALADWVRHVAALAVYTALSSLADRLGAEAWAERLPPRARFAARRRLESWRYGAGRDYRGLEARKAP